MTDSQAIPAEVALSRTVGNVDNTGVNAPLPFPASSISLDKLLRTACAACSEVANYGAGWGRGMCFNSSQSGNTDHPAFARYALPYAITPRGDGRWIVVNRDYKPVGIGIPCSMWVEYDAFPQWHISGAVLARVLAADCWEHILPYDAGRYLFDDSSAPWNRRRNLRAYLQRLACLAGAVEARRAVSTPPPAPPRAASASRHPPT